MNNIDKKYTDLLQDILDNGVEKKDRTGTGTLSVFGREIRHDMSEGFPLLTTKKMAWKSMVVELLWFLRGDTNIQWLVQNDCNIWVGDAYKHYTKHVKKEVSIGLVMDREKFLSRNEFIDKIKTDNEFAKKWGELGPIYGKQWRGWNTNRDVAIKTGETYPSGEFKYDFTTETIDQLSNVIDLLKSEPDSRRMMVNAWNVGDLPKMTLPPCHYGFQFYSRQLTWDEFNVLVEAKIREDYSEDEIINTLIEAHKEYRNLVLEMKELVSEQEFEMAVDNRNERVKIQKILEPVVKDIPTRTLSIIWNQRSVDTFLGLPFNIASYALLLQIIAQHVNMVPDEVIGFLGDTHLYLNHIDQAKEQIGRDYTVEERLGLYGKEDAKKAYEAGDYVYMDVLMSNIPYRSREPFPLPKVNIKPFKSFEDLVFEDFELVGYESHDRISAPLSN